MVRGVRDPRAAERIVDTARAAVAELGLAGATVRVIAARAGVSTGYVMHYFPDKAQLHRAVLARTNLDAARRAAAAGAGHRGLDAIAAIVDALLPVDRARRLAWRVWVAFWAGAEDAGGTAVGLADGRSGLAEMLARSFAEAVDDGELPPDLDIAYEADRLVVLAAGLGLLAGVGSPQRVRTTARRMLDDHLAELRRREAVAL